MKNVGIDIGSTTVKVVVMEGEKILYRIYQRHLSQVRQATLKALEGAKQFLNDTFQVAISGSAGLGLAEDAGVDFVQEVFATYKTVMEYEPDTDAVIELGGEDAKIIFLSGGLEERMNGSCAGGTGAFIDQMATLLNVTTEELDELSLKHERIYPIASRCGVFAKTDIQPLLNQGAHKEDVAASIFQAVVDQTVTGLSQGRRIEGKVLFLGGPLFFFKGLQQCFQETLKLGEGKAVFPSWAQYSVAIGAAIYTRGLEKSYTYEEFTGKLENASSRSKSTHYLKPLFANQQEHDEFIERHSKATVPWKDLAEYSGDAYLGIDCGSTTTKLVLMSDNYETLYRYYSSNQGNPVQVVREQLLKLYEACGDRVNIRYAVSTGYGEELIQHAFHLDDGIVETIAHFKAAQHFDPQVEFILDIGGQDIKCFKIKNDAIDSIMLNEACSSGCGSFIETFAKALGYSIADFSKLGLFAKHPVNLGSRCTVFMNSSVKQAQKDGASVEDISAGLSISIVKNAVYKVIRAANADDLGKHIVVQGGTFHNDAVLRAFELELGRNVTRPTIAGIMGAFGAALYARDLHLEQSTLLTAEALKSFTHTARPTTCNLCTNHCSLTVNTFDGGRRFISGNRCSRPLGKERTENPDLMHYKYKRLRALQGKGKGNGIRGRMGIPFGLNMYENLPFWFEFFTRLNFEVVLSPESSRKLYLKGQHTIPSDTVCYPAKLLHGHVEALVEAGVDAIWYPCMSYNNDEGIGDNHYNCPVVAYYPELLAANVPILKQTRFLDPYVGLWRHKDFAKHISKLMHEQFSIPKRETEAAVKAAYEAYDAYVHDVRETGKRYIEYARAHDMPIIVACGRPYHIDPEINHGINDLITSFGFVLVTEDALSYLEGYAPRRVLNQWTFQSRMYNAARYVCTQPDMQVVQLVSFGCGTDAITTDELRDILEQGGKLYTQLKIDDISNLGAVTIRVRSLMAAMEARKAQS
mgnify:CR=1 FL=1